MKIKELREKSVEELKDMLKNSQEKMSEFKFKVAINQMKNVREIRKTRILISQILTLLSEK